MLSGGERPSKAFGRDRVCRQAGCTTKLSMYNNGKYCFPARAHGGAPYPGQEDRLSRSWRSIRTALAPAPRA